MALPRKVREQGEAADAALKKLDEERRKESGLMVDGNPAANTDLKDDLPVPGIVTPEGIPQDPGTVQPVPGEINWQEEAAAQKAEAERLKQSLSVLQGKYNSEIAPLNEEIRNLKAGMANLQSATPAPGAAPGSPVATGLSQEKLDEVREMYGDTMVDLIQSVAATAQASALAAVRPEIENLTKSTSEDKYTAMNKRISAVHSDWEKIDGLATWINFLNEVDEATGVPRRETIERAFHLYNEKPLVLAMTQFKQRSNIGGAALETQVVPENTARTQQEDAAGGDQNQYRRDAVEQFYTKATEKLKQGKMTMDEYDRLDRIYTTAEIEGRIVG